MIRTGVRSFVSMFVVAACGALVGCGGGSASAPSMPGSSVASASVSRAYPTAGGAIAIPALDGYSGTLTVPEPTASIPAGTTIVVTAFAGAAPNVPALPAADSLLTGPGSTTPIFAVSYSPSGSIPLTVGGQKSSGSPAASLLVPTSQLPSGAVAGQLSAQAALFVPEPGGGTIQVATQQCGVSMTPSGAEITYAGSPNQATLQPGITYTIEFFVVSTGA
jgi:hypothetical protein